MVIIKILNSIFLLNPSIGGGAFYIREILYNFYMYNTSFTLNAAQSGNNTTNTTNTLNNHNNHNNYNNHNN